jgi:hypothetical protein
VPPRSIADKNGLKNLTGALQSTLPIFEEREPSNLDPYFDEKRLEEKESDPSD